MLEIVWQYDPDHTGPEVVPRNAAEARELLEQSNRELAEFIGRFARGERALRLVTPIVLEDLGLSAVPGQVPKQEPFAAVLGCADARVSPELVFNQAANDLFVVRVAGNVLSDECLGSLDYAVAHLGTIRLVVVLGHTGCGALGATTDLFLAPTGYLEAAASPPLRSLVDSLVPMVRIAAAALDQTHGPAVVQRAGYREALVELSVVLNAALAAAVVRRSLGSRLGSLLGVAYGVFSLENHSVGLPAELGSLEAWQPGLSEPPDDPNALADLGERLARSSYLARVLSQTQSGH